MKKYIFKRYYKCSNGEIDDENIWVRANNETEARYKIQCEYPKTVEFLLMKIEND